MKAIIGILLCMFIAMLVALVDKYIINIPYFVIVPCGMLSGVAISIFVNKIFNKKNEGE